MTDWWDNTQWHWPDVKTRICLVRPNSGSQFQINPPLSLGYLSAGLKYHGYWYIYMVDATLLNLTPYAAARKAAAHQPHVVGVQMYHGSQEWTQQFIEHMKQLHPQAVTVAGGPLPSAIPSTRFADVTVIGEGEHALASICGTARAGNTCPPIVRSYPIDVNTVPVPDWELIKPDRYFRHMAPLSVPLRGVAPAPIITSRGCPYQCKFCAGHVVHGRKVRSRDVANIIGEMRLLQRAFGVDEIFFSDDNLTFDIERARHLFEAMIPLRLHWRAPNGLKYQHLDGDMIDLMAKSGCYYVGFGVESGSARIQKHCLKTIDEEKLVEVVGHMRKRGIMTSGFYISGLPTETWADRIASVRSAWRIPFDRIQVSPFVPLPGSEFSNEQEDSDGRWNLIQTLLFYVNPRVILSVVKRFRWQQVVSLLKHPALKLWGVA